MKTIQDNIDLVKLERHFTKLQEEVQKLESELASMGVNDAKEKYKAASTEIRERQIKIERWNGRLQGFGEEKRNIKKKLGEAEYKNVDEMVRWGQNKTPYIETGGWSTPVMVQMVL